MADIPPIINGNSGICVLCNEAVLEHDDWMPLNPAEQAHRECSLREVMGGIGHHIAHEYWCKQMHDPDAGLTRRQSSQLVMALVAILGVEEVVQRGAVRDFYQ